MSGMDKARSAFPLQITLLDGSTAVNNIAVTGITTEDEIIFCGEFDTKISIATFTDLTSEVEITSDGNIQLASTNTSSNQLMLFWNDLSI